MHASLCKSSFVKLENYAIKFLFCSCVVLCLCLVCLVSLSCVLCCCLCLVFGVCVFLLCLVFVSLSCVLIFVFIVFLSCVPCPSCSCLCFVSVFVSLSCVLEFVLCLVSCVIVFVLCLVLLSLSCVLCLCLASCVLCRCLYLCRFFVLCSSSLVPLPVCTCCRYTICLNRQWKSQTFSRIQRHGLSCLVLPCLAFFRPFSRDVFSCPVLSRLTWLSCFALPLPHPICLIFRVLSYYLSFVLVFAYS